MAQIKKLSTELQVKDKLLDTSGDAGTSGQILSSTGTGTNWINAATFSGGTVANATTFSSLATFNNDILANGHIYGRAVDGQSSRLYRFGGIYLTWDSDSYGTNDHHSLRSTYGNSFTDSITLNSFNHIRFNIDSNDNNSTSYFEVGDGTTSTSNVIFRIDQAGDITITGDSTTSGDFTIADNKGLMLGTGGDAFFKHTGSAFNFFNDTGHVTFTQRVTDGNISFKSDNGSGGETEYFKLEGANTRVLYSKPINLIDDVPLQIGNSQDLRLYHNGSHSYIAQAGVGNLYIQQEVNDGDIVFISDNGSGGVAEYFRLDGGMVNGSSVLGATKFPDKSKIYVGTGGDLEIFHDGTNTYLENYTGDFIFTQAADDEAMIFKCDNGSGGTTEYFRLDGALGYTVTSKHILFNDSVKARFGNSGDLEIYHDGSNSHIDDTGTGNLVLRGNGAVSIQKYLGENLAMFNADGSVELYYDNDKKFETTASGATVTGNLLVTGDLNITGDINTQTVNDLDVVDKTITVGKGQSEANSDGSGIVVDGSGASILWDEPNNEWEVNKDLSIYTGAGIATLIVGRNANERLIIDQTDNETVLTADNDSDGDSEHNFRLNRTFEGSGANNFKIQKSGTDQLTIDTNANATFKGKINAKGGSSVTGFYAATINAYTATVSSNLYSALRIVDNTAASTYWDIGAVGGASPDLKFFVNASTSPKLTLSTAGNATFSGTISTTGIVSTLGNSVLINYSGNDGNGNDAGLKIMNDGNDWGAYIRKTSNANYGLRIDSGGSHALSIYSTTGGSTKTFGVNGSNGDTTIAGALSVGGTLSTVGLQITSDDNFYRSTINSATGSESYTASEWNRIIEISGSSGRGRCRFLIQTNGGSGTPCRVEGIVNTAWSNANATLSIIHNSYPNFITDIRVVRNSTSNKSFVDIKGTGEDYVTVSILPDGSISAAVVDFTNVNTLPSGDTMEIHQTLTNMIMSLSSGQGSGNGYDGNAGTGQKPFQVKYDGSIYAEQGSFENNVVAAVGSAGTPTYTFTGKTDTGMYARNHSSNDRLAFSVDGTERGYFDSNGLQVIGNLYLNNGNSVRNYSGTWRATTGQSGNGFTFANTADNSGAVLLSITSDSSAASASVATFAGDILAEGGDITVKDTGTENAMFRAYATGTGYAGIIMDASNGDGSGSDYFTIRQLDNKQVEFNSRVNAGNTLFYSKGSLNLTQDGANSTFANNVTVTNNLTANLLYTDFVQTRNGTKIDFRHQDGSVIMMIDTDDARVGIGHTAPNKKLVIKSSGADDGINLRRNSNDAVIATVIETGSGDGALLLATNAGVTKNLLRGSGNNYINGGNLGVNTSSPAQKLHVVGTQIRLDNNSGGGGGYYLHDGSGTFRAALWDNGTDTRLFADGNGSTAAITIESNNATFAGDVSVGNDLLIKPSWSSGAFPLIYIGPSNSHALVRDMTNNRLELRAASYNSTNQDILIDSSGDITLDAAGNDIRLFKNGVEYGKFKQYNSGVGLYVSVQDKDFSVLGNDGGNTITAFGLDMSEGGKATFASTVRAALGNKGEPSYSFTGDTNTGMYSDAADTLKFTAGGNNMLHVNVDAGKVGVVGNLTVSSNIEDRNIPCLFNSNLQDLSGTTRRFVPFNSTTVNAVSSPTVVNYLVMPYAGRVKKVYFKRVAGSSGTGFNITMYIYKNGANVANSGGIAWPSSHQAAWSPTSNNTFAAGDTIAIAFQKTTSGVTLGHVSVGLAVELTDYDI